MNPTRGDIIGLVLSYVYAFGLLLGVEALGRRLHWPQYLTRKLVHIGAGMWIWGILGLFDTWYLGLIPFATFIVLNYLFYRYQIFKAMDAAGATPGTVYFAFAITLLFALLWRTDGMPIRTDGMPIRTDGAPDRAPIAAAAVMAMTWGDGVASIVGQSVGRRTYTVLGHTRTWEGTAAMFALSFVTIALTLALLPGSAWSPQSPAMGGGAALGLALAGSLAAAAAEGLSPAGTDNLTVPFLTAAVLYLLT